MNSLISSDAGYKKRLTQYSGIMVHRKKPIGLCVAITFGVISPNISTNTVTVAIWMVMAFSTSMLNCPASETVMATLKIDARVFIRLFPIRMVTSNFLGLSIKNKVYRNKRGFLWNPLLSNALSVPNNATSEPLKRAERTKQPSNPESKINSVDKYASRQLKRKILVRIRCRSGFSRVSRG